MAERNNNFREPFSFHSCDPPLGMEYYDLGCLTKMQQMRLNNHKIEVVRENQKYLHKHPEIRAIMNIIMRKLLIERPTHDIERFIGEYFRKEWDSIQEEVNEYVNALPGKPLPDDRSQKIRKSVTLGERLVEIAPMSAIMEDPQRSQIVKEILADVLERVDDLCQQRVNESSDAVEIIDENRPPTSVKTDQDDQVMLELGLDFDLDFSGYHEEDD